MHHRHLLDQRGEASRGAAASIGREEKVATAFTAAAKQAQQNRQILPHSGRKRAPRRVDHLLGQPGETRRSIAHEHPQRRRITAFEQAGAEIITVGPLAGAEFAMADVLKALAERGVTRLLAEGGSRLTAALLRENLIDRVAWFRAPRIMGGDGIPVAGPIGVDSVESASRFVRVSAREIGDDRLETYVFQG